MTYTGQVHPIGYIRTLPIPVFFIRDNGALFALNNHLQDRFVKTLYP
jgi:hypothetical protein